SLALIQFSYAQVPDNWHHLDLAKDTLWGISSDRTYNELLKGRKSTKIIVAVIDSGIDTAHEDLKGVMWTNRKESAGNGVDDDKNGYTDDIHGWSFIGSVRGNVDVDNLEITRLYRMLKPKYENADPKKVDNKKEYALYLKVKTDFDSRLKENKDN